jgi:hypothetical protein
VLILKSISPKVESLGTIMLRLKKFIPGIAVLMIVFGLARGRAGAEIFYPWKDVFIGALDGGAWPGLVLVPDKDSAFAFRVKVERAGKTAEASDFFWLVSEVGPNSPDGQYARMRFDLDLPFGQGKDTPVRIKPAAKSGTMTIEWSRQDEKTVLGRIRCPEKTKISLVFYSPWDIPAVYEMDPEGRVRGHSGPDTRTQRFILWTDRPGAVSTSRPLELAFDSEDDRSLYFVAGVGEDARNTRNHIYRYQNRATIDSILSDEESSLRKKRLAVDGLYSEVPEAISNNLFWMILYQPGRNRLYTPAGRRWIFPKPDGTSDRWTIFEWDSFFNALELAVESPRHAVDAVQAVLETQYPNGNIPNWRSETGGTADRSQPPVGSYVVLKLFQRIGDMEILRRAYPYLEKWHSFWTARKANGQPRRDGNGDGLLEWGSDVDLLAKSVPPWEAKAPPKQRAMWESGMDDLPNWDEASYSDESGTLKMNCVDLNSLYALDAWCLSQIADILGQEREAGEYLEEYERMKALVNAKLWNEREGFYFDRFWDGRFSTRRAASNFFPLIARIPDERRALRVLKQMLDPKRFWGDFVIPTISRDDPAYKDQQYWRGTIWPPTNYLVYQGLKAYGFDPVAADFARKSSDLFLRSWRSFQICPENFDSRTGEAGGQRYQSWGPLFALTALEEYLDFTPWEGFRFGMINPEKSGTLSRMAIQGRHYEVEVSKSRTILRDEDKTVVKADGGAVFRHFLYTEAEVSFEVKSLDPREIKIWFMKKGKYQVLVDGREIRVFAGKSVVFDVPAGDHTVIAMLLEDREKE